MKRPFGIAAIFARLLKPEIVIAPLIVATFTLMPASAPPAFATTGPDCSVKPEDAADYTHIQDALDNPDCAAINVEPGTYFENVAIHRSVTINGSPTGGTIVDGQGKAPVFDISGTGVVVTMTNLTIQHGDFLVGGGILLNDAALTLVNSTVVNNVAGTTRLGGSGGGIDNAGTLTIMGSTIANNTVVVGNNVGQGGGIFSLGPLSIVNSRIVNNHVDGPGGMGGGIAGDAALVNTVIANNTASQNANCFGIYSGGPGLRFPGANCSNTP